MKVWFRWFSGLPNALLFTPNLKDLLICKNLSNLLSILSLNASTIWVRIPLGVKVKGASPVIPRPGKTQVSKQAPKAKAKAKAKAQNDKMKDWHVFWGDGWFWMLGLSERMSWMSFGVFVWWNMGINHITVPCVFSHRFLGEVLKVAGGNFGVGGSRHVWCRYQQLLISSFLWR